MTLAASKYKDYVAKVLRMQAAMKRRPPDELKALSDFFEHYAKVISVFELKNGTQTEVLSMHAALLGIKKSESATGFMSDYFEDLCQRAAAGIAALAFKELPPAGMEMLERWVELTAFCTIGLLEWAKPIAVQEKEEDEKKAIAVDPKFYGELVLTLFFYSDYPRQCFLKMAESLGAEGEAKEKIVNAFEMITEVAAIIAYSKKDEWFEEPLLTALKTKLSEHVEKMNSWLDEASMEERLQVNFRGILGELALALEKEEPEAFRQLFFDLLESASFPQEAMQEDVKAMKQIFVNFNAAYKAAKENKSTAINFIG